MWVFNSPPINYQRSIRCSAFVALMFLTGCQAAPVAVCPEPIPYTPEEQAEAGREMRDLATENKAPTLRRWIVDYGQERAKLRAC